MTRRRLKQMRAARLRYYARCQIRFSAAGLTARGTVRKRKTWTELGVLRGQQRKLERERRERQAFIASGLNWRGRPRTNRRHAELQPFHGRERRRRLLRILYHEKKRSPLEIRWREFRNQMEAA